MLTSRRALSPQKLSLAIDQITDSLRRTRGVPPEKPNDFEIVTSDQLMNIYKQITGAFYIVMLAISSIALLVGGIGVMNIMLVSVTERTREIGIRKAIGARRSDITRQFLIEAVILCLLGGAIGIALGCGLGVVVDRLTPLSARVSVASIVLGFGVSTAVGIVFGLWPAVRAARLDPVESLRYE